MPMPKLDPKLERKAQFHAWEIYRDMGYGRSFRQTAKLSGRSTSTIARWARMYKWSERLEEHRAVVAKKQARGDMIKVDDPIAKRMLTMMTQLELLVSSAFHKTELGTFELSADVTVKSVEELTKLVGEYRKFLETYNKLIAEHLPSGKEEKRNVDIGEFNLYMQNLSQEERIAIMKGLKSDGTKHRGDKQLKGNIQDADFREVPERGNED